jgi:hypothetical protein
MTSGLQWNDCVNTHLSQHSNIPKTDAYWGGHILAPELQGQNLDRGRQAVLGSEIGLLTAHGHTGTRAIHGHTDTQPNHGHTGNRPASGHLGTGTQSIHGHTGTGIKETQVTWRNNPPTLAFAKAGAAPGTTGGVEPALS